MKVRWLHLAAAASVFAATTASAQGSFSVVPTLSYVGTSGDLIKTATYTMTNFYTDPNTGNPIASAPGTFGLKANGGLSVGLVVEYAINKQVSLAGQVGRTLGGLQTGQTQFFINPTYAPRDSNTFETDMATTNLGAMLVIRPLGRTPSGAPNKVYLEVGGGLTFYRFSSGFRNPGPNDDYLNFNYNTPYVMAGAGVSFPVGRRVSLQIFGRAYNQMQAYNAPTLVSTNGALNQIFANGTSTGTVPKGEKPLLLQFGTGLRVGR